MTRPAVPTAASLYRQMMDNPEAAKSVGGSIGNAYRAGRAGQPMPSWIPQRTEAHAAYRAGRDTARVMAQSGEPKPGTMPAIIWIDARAEPPAMKAPDDWGWPTSKPVLVWTASGEMKIATREHSDADFPPQWISKCSERWEIKDVLYWRPLPLTPAGLEYAA
jgi:hypothetical protein